MAYAQLRIAASPGVPEHVFEGTIAHDGQFTISAEDGNYIYVWIHRIGCRDREWLIAMGFVIAAESHDGPSGAESDNDPGYQLFRCLKTAWATACAAYRTRRAL